MYLITKGTIPHILVTKCSTLKRWWRDAYRLQRNSSMPCHFFSTQANKQVRSVLRFTDELLKVRDRSVGQYATSWDKKKKENSCIAFTFFFFLNMKMYFKGIPMCPVRSAIQSGSGGLLTSLMKTSCWREQQKAAFFVIRSFAYRFTIWTISAYRVKTWSNTKPRWRTSSKFKSTPLKSQHFPFQGLERDLGIPVAWCMWN